MFVELENKAPNEGAKFFMYTEGLKPPIGMQVLLKHPELLAEAKQLAERAYVTLISSK